MEIMISVEQGDITKVPFDAIVNAANNSLLGGGGVDGAIHRAGGPEILEACMAIRERQGGCPTGEAVITTGGLLPARHVIHTVGPVYRDGKNGEPELLKACYRNSLLLAKAHGLKTIAFPNISTGVYGYPKAAACDIAIASVRQFAGEFPAALNEVRFVCFDEENYALYCEKLSR